VITASRLRENIYRILDGVAESGVPVEIVRKGVVLRIVPEIKRSKLARLKKRRAFEGDSNEIVDINWLSEWNGKRK